MQTTSREDDEPRAAQARGAAEASPGANPRAARPAPGEPHPDPPAFSRRGLLLAGGALGVLGLGGVRAVSGPRGELPFAWVADRDGHAALAVDTRLLLQRRVELRSPVRIGARADGGAWVVEAPEGPLGSHLLGRLSPEGGREHVLSLAPLRDLAVIDGGAALVVSGAFGPAEPIRVLWVNSASEVVRFAAPPGAMTAAGRGDSVAVAGEGGRVWLFGASDPLVPVAQAEFGGMAVALAAGPRGDGWWLLDAALGGRLLRLGGDLGLRWEVPLGFSAWALAADPAAERVWLAAEDEPMLLRYGAGGALELKLARLPLGGLARGSALGDGGALWAGIGALARFDGGGAFTQSQGGFHFLVDASARPSP